MAAEVGSLYVALRSDATAFTGGINRATTGIDRFGRRATASLGTAQAAALRLQATTVGLASNLARLPSALGLGVGAIGVSGLSRSIMEVVNSTDALVKKARQVGVSFEDLQRARYGFDLVGVSVETTNEFLTQFSRRLAEAANKGGELADVLAVNGIAIRDSEGNIRPLMDLLRDYANLVKGARTEGEKLQLAHIAGGRSAADFALAMHDGAAGIDAAMKAADEAGVVLSNDLAPSVEEVNDAFTKLQAQLSVGFKRVVLGAIKDVRDLQGELSLGARLAKWAAETIGHLESAEDRAKGTLRLKLRLGRFDTEGFTLEDLGGLPGATVPATVIPTKPEKPIRSRTERDAVADLISTLKHELDVLRLTGAERAVANNLRRAGAEATVEERQQIEGLTRSIFDLEEAQARAAEEAKFLGDEAFDAISGLLIDGKSAVDVVNDLARSLARAALQAALLGTGPLAGLFGGGGGILGGIASAFAGRVPMTTGALYHGGGQVGAGGMTRRVPSAVFAGAPRFHTGLRSNERAAIFEKGEQVLTASLAAREARTMAGLTALAAGAGGGGGEVNIVVKNELGVPAEASAKRGASGEIEVLLRQVKGDVARDIAGNGVVGKAIGNTFSVSRRKR